VKIAALMSFYDDPPESVERAIRSVSELATHLVAVDGAYGSFPSGEARSPASNIEAIVAATTACELELTLHQASDVWAGGEVEKRDFMYRLADTTKADWYTILDTDFVFEFPYRSGVEDVFADLRVAAKRGYEVGKVRLIDFVGSEDHKARRRVESDLPLFYRAAGLPPIRIGPTHYHTWREGYEKHLWGCGGTPQHPHFDMVDTVHVRHEWWHRSDERQIRKWTYYHQREQAGLEPNPFAPVLVAATAEED
jgi:hypothetical protein